MIFEGFPDALFPSVSSDYYWRTMLGEWWAPHKTVVIAGLARNVENVIEQNKARIDKIGSLFKSYKVIVFENDSTDNTLVALKNWNADVLSKVDNCKPLGNEKDLFRRQKLAEYRNIYLTYIREKYLDYDYLIQLDFDLKGGWSYEGILNSIYWMTRDNDKDIIGSNGLIEQEGRMLYYDSWALRLMEEKTEGEKNLYLKGKGTDLEEVKSIFGGLSIMKMECIKNQEIFDETDCDHVTLLAKLRNLGHKVWFNPSMICLYSPTCYTIGR